MIGSNKSAATGRGRQWSDIAAQFQGLGGKDPSIWPVLPRTLLCIALVLCTLGAAWYLHLRGLQDELRSEQERENSLKSEYVQKLAKAINLQDLKQQREQVQQYVLQLERQLPNKSEMAALLSDINQAGMGRNLQFELFKPGNESVRDYYAELPISVRVTGRFHDVGSFAADVAHLPRIVTLSNIVLTPLAKDVKDNSGLLALEAVAHTYRYLEKNENAASANPQHSVGGMK